MIALFYIKTPKGTNASFALKYGMPAKYIPETVVQRDFNTWASNFLIYHQTKGFKLELKLKANVEAGYRIFKRQGLTRLNKKKEKLTKELEEVNLLLNAKRRG